MSHPGLVQGGGHRLAAEFADDHRKCSGRSLHLGDPLRHGVALERIGVVRIDHAVALGIGKQPALQETRHVVCPVQPAGDHNIPRTCFAHGIEQRLHPDGLVRSFGVPWERFLGNLTAPLPDVPTDIMRVVVKVEYHGRMILENTCEILPEHQAVAVGHEMLPDLFAPLARVRPVQVENDVAAFRRASVHDQMDQGAISLALILLIGHLAEPSILRQRQADHVDMPVSDRGVHRGENVPLAVAAPFKAGCVDPAQPHGLVPAVDDSGSVHFQGKGHGPAFRRRASFRRRNLRPDGGIQHGRGCRANQDRDDEDREELSHDHFPANSL